MSRLLLCIFLSVSCQDKDEEPTDSGLELDVESDTDTDTDADTDTDPDTDSDTDTGATEMPPAPHPFTVTLSDGRTLGFDLPTCQQYRGSTNFRMFWREEARSHTYVMTLEVMMTFTGAGTYASSEHRAGVKLQEEAPQTGAPTYWTDTSLGDEATLTIDYIDENVAWGSATVNRLHAIESGEEISIDPAELPIWCPDVEI